MANILDYLHWRGDLSFQQEPFCDVDALVLCRLAYVPFDGVVPGGFDEAPVTINHAAERCLALVRERDGGRAFRMADDEQLLNGLMQSERFRSLQLIGYENRFSEQIEEQFSATTILLPDEALFVAFRGTDGTIVGWKEDFNMSFSGTVPAQRDAVRYLEAAADRFPGKLRVGGHSKGGNLAAYAAAFCKESVQNRILGVCNNDGPGFSGETVEKRGFQRILNRVRTYLPQSSVVGMLLEHEEDFSILHSTNHGLAQHDVYSWEVFRNRFIPVEELTNSSKFIDRTLKDWVANMTPELREKMIDGIFGVLGASDGVTLRDLWNGKNTIAVLKAFGEMDDQTKALLKEAYSILRSSMKRSLPTLIDELMIQSPQFDAISRNPLLSRLIPPLGAQEDLSTGGGSPAEG